MTTPTSPNVITKVVAIPKTLDKKGLDVGFPFLESLIFLLFFFFKGRSSERDAIVPVHDKTTHEQGCNKLMSEEKKRKTDVKGKG